MATKFVNYKKQVLEKSGNIVDNNILTIISNGWSTDTTIKDSVRYVLEYLATLKK